MNCYVYKYMFGLATCKCLVMAEDETKARDLFFKSHPTLRPYNLISVAQTNGRVYQLR